MLIEAMRRVDLGTALLRTWKRALKLIFDKERFNVVYIHTESATDRNYSVWSFFDQKDFSNPNNNKSEGSDCLSLSVVLLMSMCQERYTSFWECFGELYWYWPGKWASCPDWWGRNSARFPRWDLGELWWWTRYEEPHSSRITRNTWWDVWNI